MACNLITGQNERGSSMSAHVLLNLLPPCMLSNFACSLSSANITLKLKIYKCQEYLPNVKKFGPRPGLMRWFQIVCKRYQQNTLAGKELNELRETVFVGLAKRWQ